MGFGIGSLATSGPYEIRSCSEAVIRLLRGVPHSTVLRLFHRRRSQGVIQRSLVIVDRVIRADVMLKRQCIRSEESLRIILNEGE